MTHDLPGRFLIQYVLPVTVGALQHGRLLRTGVGQNEGKDILGAGFLQKAHGIRRSQFQGRCGGSRRHLTAMGRALARQASGFLGTLQAGSPPEQRGGARMILFHHVAKGSGWSRHESTGTITASLVVGGGLSFAIHQIGDGFGKHDKWLCDECSKKVSCRVKDSDRNESRWWVCHTLTNSNGVEHVGSCFDVRCTLNGFKKRCATKLEVFLQRCDGGLPVAME